MVRLPIRRGLDQIGRIVGCVDILRAREVLRSLTRAVTAPDPGPRISTMVICHGLESNGYPLEPQSDGCRTQLVVVRRGWLVSIRCQLGIELGAELSQYDENGDKTVFLRSRSSGCEVDVHLFSQ